MARITKSLPERRKEIVETAKAVFIEKGFDNSQISDISQKMNVSQGLVYHYFKSKVEMLYAVIDEIAEDKQKEIDTTLYSIDRTASQKLATLLNIKMNSDGLDKLIPSITSDAAIIEYCSKKISSSAMPMILSLIKQGNSDGSWNCGFPEETALFMSNGFRGFYDNMGTSNDNSKKKKALMNIILRVLGSSPNQEGSE